MKTLILVRHAKSSWDEPHLADYERKLNNRGLRDAPFMGEKLKERNVNPDLILSSPAVRAFKTATFFADALNFPIEKIIIKELIYDKGPRDILYMINEQDDNLKTIMLFGHNPDLSSLTNYLCDFNEGNLPTCGTVCIDFKTDSWVNIGDEKGKLRFYDSPKKYF
ncbi:MAG: histidine phosphatase family protein [bacterium]